jgi:peroxiredoxin
MKMITRTVYLSLLCIMLSIASCNPEKRSEAELQHSGRLTRIQGQVMGGEGGEVVLEEMTAREYIPVDTVSCDGTGRFQIGWEPEKVAFYVLRTGAPGYVTLLVEPGEVIEFMGNIEHSGEFSVKGSAGSELLMELSRIHEQTLDSLSLIARRSMELSSSPDYSEKKLELDRQFDSISDAFRDYSEEFIHQNSHSLVILTALYNLYGQGLPVFHPVKDLEVYQFVDSCLTSRYPGFEVVDLLHSQLLEARVTGSPSEGTEGLARGEIAPDFVSSRPDGSALALSDLKGNYILLSFWAGWSKPSKEENRYISEIWNKYGHLPFRVLQVSLDSQKEVWLAAIEEGGLTWDHVSDLRRWETVVADLYHLDKIPSNYLIGPDGRIIDKDLFGTELVTRVDELLSTK